MLYFARSSRVKPLLDSMRARFFVGPTTGMVCCPECVGDARGEGGFRANDCESGGVLSGESDDDFNIGYASGAISNAELWMPGLCVEPKHKSVGRCGERARAAAMACSRAPEPMMRMRSVIVRGPP